MNPKLFASAEFYRKRYQNFSTMIIMPVFIFLLGILALITWGKVDVNVNSSGSINPAQQIYPLLGDSNKIIHKYVVDGQAVQKGRKLFSYLENNQSVMVKAPNQGVVYLTEQAGKLGYLYPKLATHNLIVNTYLPAKNVGEVNTNQTVYFSIQLNGQTTFISGKVLSIAHLPQSYRGASYYLAKCSIKPNTKQLKQLRYGMNGQLAIKTARVSILEYLKRTFS